jgi:hypothetical protein
MRRDRAQAGRGLSRRGGPERGLFHPGAAETADRARDDTPTRRDGRTLLRPCPRSRQHAPGLAARTREHPQAPCRRVQSRRADARHARPGHAKGGCNGLHLRLTNRRRAGIRADRRQRLRNRSARRHRRRTDLKLKTGLRQRAYRGYRDKVTTKAGAASTK